MPYRDSLDVLHKLLELCKYQQNIIKQYQEYIEKHIYTKILEEDCSHKIGFGLDEVVAKRITIPETTFMQLCEPWILKEWNWLKAQTPLISPDYFINIAYKEQKERNNVDSN